MDKKIRRIAALALGLFIISAGVLLTREKTLTVYITNTGTKYHRESCSSLSKSRIPITLEEAVERGYEPCGICQPPGYGETRQEPAREDDSLYRVNKEALSSIQEGNIEAMLQAEVVGHVDGDTIKVRIWGPLPEGLNENETIRLIGVDTPETVHPSKPVEAFGKEASDYTREKLFGKTVYLAFDWDLRDRYGRLLAYIYTGHEACHNADLIEEGYAFAYTSYAFQFLDEFRELEKIARENKTGLWNE